MLPSGFYKIRHFGLLASVHTHTKREQAIQLIGRIKWLPLLEGLTAYEVVRHLTGLMNKVAITATLFFY
ncbi:hypothetical protein DMA11_08590 [Marinilabiliaceae bacterium JC017]|nr:hypothetical protein DMA11_08590 [Marinilabiliaceae bacterium JC017]